MAKRNYIKLFRKEENIRDAIWMINQGYAFRFIGKTLGCDRTSVISWRDRMEKEGIVFKKRRKKFITIPDSLYDKRFRGKNKEEPSVIVKIFPELYEKLNPGKNYKEYLSIDIKKRKIRQAANMEKAKIVIGKLQEKRKEEGIVEICNLWNS